MKEKTIIIVIICIMLFFNCSSKPVPEDKRSYIGKWSGREMYLEITHSGRVSYNRKVNGINKSVNAPIQKFEGDDFIVGVWFIKTKFNVNKPPYKKKNVWKMVVDGVELIRINSDIINTIPERSRMLKMVNRSMSLFAVSVKRRNFSVFYKSISKLWQSQITSEELRSIFKVFTENNIDFTLLIKTEPVFSDSIHIDE